MNRRICLLVCEHLRNEAIAALRELTTPHFRCEVVAFDAACHKSPGQSRHLPQLLEALQPFFADGIHVLGSNCISSAQIASVGKTNLFFHRTDSCFALLCNEQLVDQLIGDGAYLLSPGWLRRSGNILADWGFDQQTARAFFDECAKELVLLDTGILRDSDERLQVLAAYLERPSRSLMVGTDVLGLHLYKLLRMGEVAGDSQKKLDSALSSSRQASEYAMAFDLIGRLDRLQNEQQTARAILEILKVLFAPARCEYYPVDPLAKSCRTDDGVSHPESGIALELKHEGVRLAVVMAEEVALPDHLRHYRNLAVQLAPVFAMAVANVRSIEKIRLQERKLAEELALAGAAQRELLQPAMENSDVLVAPIYEPYRWVSGDAYGDRWFAHRRCLRGYVLDITGHNVATALQTTATSVILQRALTESPYWDKQYLADLNQQLMQYFTETTFAALLLFELDLAQAKLRVATGGIHHYYLGTAHPDWQTTSSSLTGILQEPEFGEFECDVAQGDFFVFLTDGFYDLLSKNGSIENPSSIAAAVDMLHQCAGDPERWDDGAALCVKVLQI